MNSSDSRSEPPDSTKLKDSPAGPKERKPKWSLNKVDLDKLLNVFSSNSEEAGVQYSLAYRKVVRYFEWRSVGAAEACADETMDRVVRRIAEGKKVEKPMAYILGVARHVLQEVIKYNHERPTVSLDDAPAPYLQQSAPEPVDPDIRQICFDRCLEDLGADNRVLILGYYEGEGREKIDNRLALAKKLEIPVNALRIRVHRIKRTLEDCIAECLQTAAARNG